MVILVQGLVDIAWAEELEEGGRAWIEVMSDSVRSIAEKCRLRLACISLGAGLFDHAL